MPVEKEIWEIELAREMKDDTSVNDSLQIYV